MLPQNGVVDPNVLLMNYASAIGGLPSYPSGPALPVPTNEEAILALNLYYVQSAMAQLAAQKEMLNNRLFAQQAAAAAAAAVISVQSDESSLPPSPASMSPTRTESLSPQPDKMRNPNPYRRKRTTEDYIYNPTPKRTKNSVSSTRQTSRTVKSPVDLKQTFLDLYEVYGVIGVGGGGMVYAGRRITDKLPVAIKRVMREKVKRWEKVQGHSVPQEIALMLR